MYKKKSKKNPLNPLKNPNTVQNGRKVPKFKKISENLFKKYFFSSFFVVGFFSPPLPKKNKKTQPILLAFQYWEDTIQPEHFSPTRFRIQGGCLSITHGQMDKSKSLCLIWDLGFKNDDDQNGLT